MQMFGHWDSTQRRLPSTVDDNKDAPPITLPPPHSEDSYRRGHNHNEDTRRSSSPRLPPLPPPPGQEIDPVLKKETSQRPLDDVDKERKTHSRLHSPVPSISPSDHVKLGLREHPYEDRPYESERRDNFASPYQPYPHPPPLPQPIDYRHMPHRVEPYNSMSSSHRRHTYDSHHHRVSPPPIATLTHSPSPSVASLDRSSVSTPPVRRSPPLASGAPGYYSSDPMIHHHHQQQRHFSSRDHGYMYPPPPPPHFDHHRGPDANHSPYMPPSHHLPPNSYPPTSSPNPSSGYMHPNAVPLPYPTIPSTSQPYQIQYTEDAATKLSDRIRRRCFNCCTTDTSTWRRSNLSPGKVLCNKCGLFERTHSRPRPEQFPHKRGPLAASNLERISTTTNGVGGGLRRTPPPLGLVGGANPNTQAYGSQQQLPPISAPPSYGSYNHHPALPPPQSSHHNGPPSHSTPLPPSGGSPPEMKRNFSMSSAGAGEPLPPPPLSILKEERRESLSTSDPDKKQPSSPPRKVDEGMQRGAAEVTVV